MAGHTRWVFGIWLIALGSMAPAVFSNLAGAGWQANGSDSVAVRELAQQHFGGNASSAVQVVVHSDTHKVDSPAMQHVLSEATALFHQDQRFGEVIPPQPGMTISPDGHTGILIAGANANPHDMVKAVTDIKGRLTALSGDGVEVYPTGASALWSDCNKANHDAMLKAEMFSWPVTLAIMVLAFVAAGLPLLLTLAGLVASAGGLVLLNMITPISVWAMNFAMMFALALGIDYALFMVSRFRAALASSGDRRRAVAETMDTVGKAVVLSGLTVLVGLSAVLIVPAPAVRTMAVGIMLAVAFVLLATLTLLPATLGKLGPKVNAGSLPYAKRQQARSPLFARWGELLHRGAAGLRTGAEAAGRGRSGRAADHHARRRGRGGRAGRHRRLRVRHAAGHPDRGPVQRPDAHHRRRPARRRARGHARRWRTRREPGSAAGAERLPARGHRDHARAGTATARDCSVSTRRASWTAGDRCSSSR